ncbi:MAG: serine/threonine protein kinase [Betaproteobacteria bacterium]|nr:serine/threonine protein kinase [Betaproteobacteria bacterium]
MHTDQQMFRIAEASQVSSVRRSLAELTRAAVLSEIEAGNAAIALTEVATNMLKHAGGGEIIMRTLGEPASGVEVLALDEGPGIADWDLSVRDGYSTGSSPGNGLGAMRRLSTELDVYTGQARGSVFRMAFRREGAGAASGFEIGAVCLPIAGETECGDIWTARESDTASLFMVADGLGHGPEAARAARAAVVTAHRGTIGKPAAALDEIHGALRSTRGAAVALAHVEHGAGGPARITFAGVGNISAGLHADETRQFASHAGIVGHNMRKVSEIPQPWEEEALLIMHSDGMATRWSLEKYPGLRMRHPGVIAAVLYRDLARGRDDVTVLVVRQKKE